MFMRLRKQWAPALISRGLLCCIFAAPSASYAATCTSQAEMHGPDRDALAAAAQRLNVAVLQQDPGTLQAALLPSVAQQWDSIREAIEQGAPSVKGGQPQINAMYLLDNSANTAPADTQFFCSNADGSMTITITLGNLPPGKYGVIQSYVVGAGSGSAAPGIIAQISFILGLDSNDWKLGGVFIRPAALGGHDGVWYWQRARELAKSGSPWAAYFAYQAARYLLLPVDFISSPNLERLDQEQSAIKNAPAFPYSVSAGDRSFKIDNVHFDASLREPDLGINYENTGVTDPAAQRTEATAVMSAFLKAQPALRQGFHGLWAYALNNGKVTPVMELPMSQIP
jgi:hypothetical protein